MTPPLESAAWARRAVPAATELYQAVPAAHRGDGDPLVEHLVRMAAGDDAALRRFYDAAAGTLYGVCRQVLGEHSEAEDVLQDVFLTIWRKANVYDPTRASPITWAATIARNRSLDRLRSRRGRGSRPLEEASGVADDRDDPAACMERSEEVCRLLVAIDDLDPRAAAAIRAAFFGGMTYSGLAAAAGVPVGTMKSLIRRGLLRLRLQLQHDSGRAASKRQAQSPGDAVDFAVAGELAVVVDDERQRAAP